MDEAAHQPKISLPEVIFVGTLLFVVPDTLEIVFALVGVDDFGVSDVIFFPAAQFYLRMKGVRGSYSLVTGGLEVIPYVGALPLRTIGFLITAWLDHHPRAAGAVALVGSRALPSRTTPVQGASRATAGVNETAAPTRGAATERRTANQEGAGQDAVGINEESNEVNLKAA